MRHLIITGPGRSGTTLLVELLSKLGLDTGIDQLEYFPGAGAGWEADLLSADAPYVVKQPELIFRFRQLIETGQVVPAQIDALIVPLRNIDAAVASRINVTLSSGKASAEGGLTGTKSPAKQRSVLAVGVYELLQAAAEYDIPVVLLDYPRFALDCPYAFRRLAAVLPGVDEGQFTSAHVAVVDPERVRATPPEPPPGAAVKVIARRLWRKATHLTASTASSRTG